MYDRTVSWRAFAPATTTRQREGIEWSTNYAYNATDTTLPRVLLIGDSICNANQDRVRWLLAGKVNVSYWASSKCVTDPDYFRELDFLLEARPYDMVTFNNGLHSLHTDRAEWNGRNRRWRIPSAGSLPPTRTTPRRRAASAGCTSAWARRTRTG